MVLPIYPLDPMQAATDFVVGACAAARKDIKTNPEREYWLIVAFWKSVGRELGDVRGKISGL